MLVVVRECSSGNCQKTVVEQTRTGVSAARLEVVVKVLKDGEGYSPQTVSVLYLVGCWSANEKRISCSRLTERAVNEGE